MPRAELDYADQVPRRQAYEAVHPNVEILYLGPYWKAIIPQEAGHAIITRVELRQLLDKLESLDGDSGGKPGCGGGNLPVRANACAGSPRNGSPVASGQPLSG